MYFFGSTPARRPMLMAMAKESSIPETKDPSLAQVMKISAGLPSCSLIVTSPSQPATSNLKTLPGRVAGRSSGAREGDSVSDFGVGIGAEVGDALEPKGLSDCFELPIGRAAV